MDMVEKEKDLIDFANRVILFKEKIIKACTERGIDAPTNKQITDYINGYDIDFESFMADYTEHEGMFIGLRTPLDDFRAEINSRSWITKPTEEEILTFFNKHGNNISLFLSEHIINNMKPLEGKFYSKTIEMLPIEGLVQLWNCFIEESLLYGEDSYIFDLSKEGDKTFLEQQMNDEELKTINNMVVQNHIRYIQWTYLNDKYIRSKTDKGIKDMITAFWGEIFERIILFPTCYESINCGEGCIIEYFTEVIWSVITKEVGIEICKDTNEIKYTK